MTYYPGILLSFIEKNGFFKIWYWKQDAVYIHVILMKRLKQFIWRKTKMCFIKDIEFQKKKKRSKFSKFIYVNIDMYVHVYLDLYVCIYLTLLKSTMPRQNPSAQSYHTIIPHNHFVLHRVRELHNLNRVVLKMFCF